MNERRRKRGMWFLSAVLSVVMGLMSVLPAMAAVETSAAADTSVQTTEDTTADAGVAGVEDADPAILKDGEDGFVKKEQWEYDALDYAAGYNNGQADAIEARESKTDNFEPNSVSSDFYFAGFDYKMGYLNGYTQKQQDDYFVQYWQGRGDGILDGVYGSDRVRKDEKFYDTFHNSDAVDTDGKYYYFKKSDPNAENKDKKKGTFYWLIEDTDLNPGITVKAIEGYRRGYDDGYAFGKDTMRTAVAYQSGYNRGEMQGGRIRIIYGGDEPDIRYSEVNGSVRDKDADYNSKDQDIAYNFNESYYGKQYSDSYKEGYKDAYGKRYSQGVIAGINAGKYDGGFFKYNAATDVRTFKRPFDHASDLTGRGTENHYEGDKYYDAGHQSAVMIYNYYCKANVDSNYTLIDSWYPNEEFVKGFIEGYDSSYKKRKEETLEAFKKQIKVDAYKEGKEVGQEDADYDASLNDKNKDRKYQPADRDSLFNLITNSENRVRPVKNSRPVNPANPLGGYLDTWEDNGFTYFTEAKNYYYYYFLGGVKYYFDIEEYNLYVSCWQQGYEEGYLYYLNTAVFEDWYRIGKNFGFIDALHQQYDIDHGEYNRDYDGTVNPIEKRKNGFYEPDYEWSPYNRLEDEAVRKAYQRGYDAGWKDGTEQLKDQLGLDGSFNHVLFDEDRKDPEFNSWRITTEPTKWETATRYYVQTGSAYNAATERYDNVFFDDATKTFRNWDGGAAPGTTAAVIAAYSPFSYYFGEMDEHLLNQRKIDIVSANCLTDYVLTDPTYIDAHFADRGDKSRFSGVINHHDNWLYRAISTSSNGIYLLVRYRIGKGEDFDGVDYRNYKVKRYSYSRPDGVEGAQTEKTNIDVFNTYYNGNEPVVEYDSRKVMDVNRKPQKNTLVQDSNTEQHILEDLELFTANTAANRYEIEVDAIAVSWTEGQPAQYLGKVPVTAKAVNNVAASVSFNYAKYLGEHANGDFYHVDEAKRKDHRKQNGQDGLEVEKDHDPEVTFKGIACTEKLTKAENVSIKKGSPSFTLKIGKIDPMMKAYSKDIKKALKSPDATFNFEIKRFKIADEYENKMLAIKQEFSYPSALYEKDPNGPMRGDYASFDEFMKAVNEYEGNMASLDIKENSVSYKEALYKELQDVQAAYKTALSANLAYYGPQAADFEAWLEKENAPMGLVGRKEYTYVNRYSPDYYKDGNKDGTVTAIEQWEYDYIYGPDGFKKGFKADALEDPLFNGKIDPGENVFYNKRAVDFVFGEQDIDTDIQDFMNLLVANPNADPSLRNTQWWGHWVFDDEDHKEEHALYRIQDPFPLYNNLGNHTGEGKELAGDPDYGFQLYGSFLANTADGTDWLIEPANHTTPRNNFGIGLRNPDVEDYADGATFIDPSLGHAPDNSFIIKHQIKVKKKVPELQVTPYYGLQIRQKNGLIKNILKKIGTGGKKAEIVFTNLVSAEEPLSLMAGQNDLEGDIVVRRRANGETGYGYWKDENHSFIFSEDE